VLLFLAITFAQVVSSFHRFVHDESFWAEVEEFLVAKMAADDDDQQQAASDGDQYSVAGRALAALVQTCSRRPSDAPMNALLALVGDSRSSILYFFFPVAHVAFYSKAILMSFKRFIQIISLLHSKQQL
jgi:hypothetical protein